MFLYSNVVMDHENKAGHLWSGYFTNISLILKMRLRVWEDSLVNKLHAMQTQSEFGFLAPTWKAKCSSLPIIPALGRQRSAELDGLDTDEVEIPCPKNGKVIRTDT